MGKYILMKFTSFVALFLAGTQAIKLARDNNVSTNETVRPPGEAHIEPPGQARNFQPAKAHGQKGWDCVNYDLDGKLGPGMCETAGISRSDVKAALPADKEEKK